MVLQQDIFKIIHISKNATKMYQYIKVNNKYQMLTKNYTTEKFDLKSRKNRKYNNDFFRRSKIGYTRHQITLQRFQTNLDM